MKIPHVLALLSLVAGLLAIAGSGAAAAEPNAGSYLVYVGTYTGPKSKGIYAFRFSPSTGTATPIGLVGETTSPSFLAIHPSQKFLYAVNEVSNFGGKKAGSITAFAINAESGKLTSLNQASAGGAGPCHLVVDKAGKNVLVANYGGGSVGAVPISADGTLGEPSAFIQHTGTGMSGGKVKPPHAHSINLDAANQIAFAADAGLDKIFLYDFDPAKGSLTPHAPPFAAVTSGNGPRHFAFHPQGKFAYVINETVCSMTAFAYDAARGELKEIQTLSTLPAGESVKAGYSTAEVVAHPTGRFLYGSNRGHDTIVVFAIDPATGKLTYVENTPTGGKIPRNFNVDPTGGYLFAANSSSDNIVIFRIDARTGRLTPTGQVLAAPSPVCVRFVKVP